MATAAELQKSIGDESTLTDQELAARLAQYQQLAGSATPTLNRNTLLNAIQQRYAQFDPKTPGLDSRANNLADVIMANGGKLPEQYLNPASFGGQNPQYLLENAADLQGYQIINSNLAGGAFNDPAADYSGDIKRIQDLIGARETAGKNQADIQNLVSNLPKQLSANTDQFVQGLEQQGQQTLEQQLLPESLAGLAQRGLIDAGGTRSGDLESSLQADTANVYGGIQDQYTQMQLADSQYLQNAAYQVQLQQDLAAGANLSQDITAKQDEALNSQQQRFSAGQNQLNQNLNQTLFNKQQQRLLQQQATAAARSRDQASAANSAGLASGIGSAVGAIGGAVVGGPVGSVIGQQGGGLIGKSIAGG